MTEAKYTALPLAVRLRDEACFPLPQMVAQRRAQLENEQTVTHPTKWECAARKQSLPEPADCDWPVCGCDSHADKVIAALEESGKLNSHASLKQRVEELEGALTQLLPTIRSVDEETTVAVEAAHAALAPSRVVK